MQEGAQVAEDGLLTPEVGSWSEDKYKLVGLYAGLFSTGMKFKWQQRVYIDLYAGAGIVRVARTGKLLLGSPLIALKARDPFDLYIFCEEDPEKLDALRLRAEKVSQKKKVLYVHGNCNTVIDKICNLIPTASSDNKVLSLCFVDPYDIGIKFSTIKKLSARFVDFLVLLALYMDANRNYLNYLRTENTKVDDFLGMPEWREIWEREKFAPVRFPDFLAQQYSRKMADLGYIDQPLHQMKLVRSDEKNLPLYRLALFSRHYKAYEFWGEVLKYSTDQPKLF